MLWTVEKFFLHNNKITGAVLYLITGTKKRAPLGTRFFNHRNKKADAIPRLITGTKKLSSIGNSVLVPVTKERVMGIEPTYPAWKAGVLPLNYTRI